jgi:hypothetical protein
LEPALDFSKLALNLFAGTQTFIRLLDCGVVGTNQGFKPPPQLNTRFWDAHQSFPCAMPASPQFSDEFILTHGRSSIGGAAGEHWSAIYRTEGANNFISSALA